MTTPTASSAASFTASFTEYAPLPMPAATLAELRRIDDAGRPMDSYVADTDSVPSSIGSPLRCCWRSIQPGDHVALVCYAPLRRWAVQTGADPGAYDEVGPIFIHADPCPGPTSSAYPFARPGALRTVRRYNARGHIIGGREFQIPDDAQAGFAQVVEEAFSDPQVVLVHVRALEYGCFQFAVGLRD